MKKLLAFLLVLVMLFTMFACTSNEDESGSGSESTDPTGSGSDDASESDTESEVKMTHLGVPERTFNGEDWIIWTSNSNIGINVLYTEEYDGTSLTKATTDRVYDLEETFDVDIKYQKLTAWGKDTEQVLDMVSSGKHDADLVSLSSSMASQSLMGIWYNLADDAVENFDFNDPWWSRKVMNEITVSDKLFTVTGELSYAAWWNVRCLYFNKTALTEKGLDYPYQAVYDGKWTYDMLMQMTEGAYQDIDEEPGKTAGDFYGFALIQQYYHGFYEMFNLDTMYKDNETGKLVYSYDLAQLKDSLDKISLLINSDHGGMLTKGTIQTAFKDNRVMFTMDALNRSHDWWAKAEGLKYGVLPAPKLDPNQDDYRCNLETFFYAIPTVVPQSDFDFVTFMTNALGAAGDYYLKPAYFEFGLKTRYADDLNNDAKMFDIIFENAQLTHGLNWYNKTGQFLEFGVDWKSTDLSANLSSFFAQWAELDAQYVDAINNAYVNPQVGVDTWTTVYGGKW